MQRDRLGQRGGARITAEEYNHSLSKLVSTKRRVKPSRKAAFMAAFPVKASPRLHPDEEGASVLPLKEASITDSGHSTTPNTNETTSNPEVNRPVGVRHKLQIFVQGLLVPKTLCLQLDPETSVSALKAHIQAESGIQPQDQHLYIGRNFQLCDLLSIRDHGIQQDQNIKLRTGGLLGGGPLGEYFSKLSHKLGHSWKPLARKLSFDEGEIFAFQDNDRGNLHEQIFQMLDAWLKKQDIPADAPEKLRVALKAVGRADLASQVQDTWWKKQDNPADTTEKMSDALREAGRADLAPQVQDTAGTYFDVEECARELAAHYLGTMKVTTHPKEKHMARDIDDICINLQLLQETNVPSPVSSSEAHLQAETGSQAEYPKASIRTAFPA
ncbi:uncharacterized protein LOC119724373 [Patiria miniata]|uniref:Ubiquitin-like domain-containing protein n=1 Tax=Patiria miniata TaxID=46514 RepID=A0A913ZJ27_PATMI|nr:uncharacterized protein LOC119724373 [Patiria miniata]